jgi:hypothetical protein
VLLVLVVGGLALLVVLPAVGSRRPEALALLRTATGRAAGRLPPQVGHAQVEVTCCGRRGSAQVCPRSCSSGTSRDALRLDCRTAESGS